MDQQPRNGGLLPNVDQQMQSFWAEISHEIDRATDLRNHSLPLARIKKIMKADEDVRMISAEAPIVFSKACEIFIQELTQRAWINTEENKRRTLQKNDVASAVTKTEVFDFLVDIVPREDPMSEDLFGVPGLPGLSADCGPYFYIGGAGDGYMPWKGFRPPAHEEGSMLDDE